MSRLNPLLWGGAASAGVTGFWYEQVTGDSGSGATFGDFEARSFGLGPVVSYSRKLGDTDFTWEMIMAGMKITRTSVPTWSNTIGSPELVTVWQDPEFDESLHAFYYVRVIEIPTPRWTAYDRIRMGVDMSAEIRLKTQEWAYTSPIWYEPGS